MYHKSGYYTQFLTKINHVNLLLAIEKNNILLFLQMLPESLNNLAPILWNKVNKTFICNQPIKSNHLSNLIVDILCNLCISKYSKDFVAAIFQFFRNRSVFLVTSNFGESLVFKNKSFVEFLNRVIILTPRDRYRSISHHVLVLFRVTN